MLPDCIACIPGTVASPNLKSCNTYIPESKNIRDEIYNLTLERYPQRPEARSFGLYPCSNKTVTNRILYCMYVCIHQLCQQDLKCMYASAFKILCLYALKNLFMYVYMYCIYVRMYSSQNVSLFI